MKFQGHSEFATQEHFQYTRMAHFQFYWLGTLQSHCWGNHKELFEWATQEYHSYILWENFEHSQDFPNGEIPVTWSGTLWMYWPFPMLGKLQENWLGKFWINLGYAGWVLAWYFVHFLVLYLWCTAPRHHPLPPVTDGNCDWVLNQLCIWIMGLPCCRWWIHSCNITMGYLF